MWAFTYHCSGRFYQTCKASLGVQDVWNVGKQWTQLGPWTHRTLLSLSLSYVNDRFWWSHELFSDDCDCASTWWPSKRSCSHPVSNCDVGVLIMQNLRNPRLTVFPFWWFMTLLASDHLSRTQHFSFVLAFFVAVLSFFCAAFSVSKDCQHMSACKAYTDQRSNYKEIRYLPNRLKGKHPALKTGPYISKPRRKKSDAEGCTSVIVDIHTGCSPKTVTTRIPGSWMFTRRIHVSLTCHCFGWWIGPMYWSRILIGTSPRSFQTFESFWFNSHRCHVDKALAGIGHGCIQNTRTVFRIWSGMSWKTYTKYPTIVKHLNTHDDMFICLNISIYINN